VNLKSSIDCGRIETTKRRLQYMAGLSGRTHDRKKRGSPGHYYTHQESVTYYPLRSSLGELGQPAVNYEHRYKKSTLRNDVTRKGTDWELVTEKSTTLQQTVKLKESIKSETESYLSGRGQVIQAREKKKTKGGEEEGEELSG